MYNACFRCSYRTILIVINRSLKDYLFTVFNRYGEKVFETRDYAKRWDGRYKGKEQSAGTYTYRIRFMTDAGWEFTDTGTVVLIR